MAALTRTNRSLPTRGLAIVACMTAIVVASQLTGVGHPALAPGSAPAEVGAAGATGVTGGVDPVAPALADLDSGAASGSTGSTGAARSAGLDRITADIAFWSARVARNRDDFVSSNRWGVSEIELARTTGDLSAFLRAEAAFNTTLLRDQANAAALGYKGSVLVSLHRFGDAAALARTVLARRPNDPVALATLGDASLELGDLAAARAAYTRVNALNPSAATLVRLGHLAFISGDTATARRSAAAAVVAADAEGAEGERAAFYRYQLADVLISTGDRPAATTAYTAAVRADPGSFLAHSGLARALAGAGDLTGAIRELSGAIAIVPQPELLARRGDLYTLRGQSGDAKLATADYATVEVIARLAGEAASVYDRTLSLYLANHGLDPARAVRLAATELTVRRDVYGYDAYAWALLAVGRPAEANAAMGTALAFGTRDAKLLYHAGMIATALGQKERARGLLEDALRLDSSFDPLQVARARQTLASLR